MRPSRICRMDLAHGSASAPTLPPRSTIHSMTAALLSYTQAADLVAARAAELARLRAPFFERLDLGLGSGRVLADPLFAGRDQPPFARPPRDGFACRAA